MTGPFIYLLFISFIHSLLDSRSTLSPKKKNTRRAANKHAGEEYTKTQNISCYRTRVTVSPGHLITCCQLIASQRAALPMRKKYPAILCPPAGSLVLGVRHLRNSRRRYCGGERGGCRYSAGRRGGAAAACSNHSATRCGGAAHVKLSLIHI